MANVLSLALKINADASGLKLDPVSKALRQLGEETDRVSGIFDKFTSTSEAAARAQAATEQALNDLIAARKAGTVTATEFAESFRTVEEAAKRQAAEFQRGADISERYATEEEKRARTLAELEQLLTAGAIKEDVYAKAVADASGATAAAAEAEKQRVAALAEAEKQRQAVLDEGLRLAQRYATEDEKRTAGLQRIQELLDQGAITEEVAARARADASGANEAAAKAEQQRAEAVRRAAQITEQNLSPLQRYDAALAELDAQLQAGRISQETYTRATEKAAKGLTDAERAARGLEAATEKIDDNAGKTTLQFNELSGIFATLPGPIGNVAGRISGLSSAGEGLGRIFAGGLSQGIGSLGASVAALTNPFTIAVAGITAFGAAATAVASGLQSLESQTERLQNAATKLGVSFGFMETLEQAASMSGISFESVNGAMSRLLKTLAGADEESKQATAALGRLGITLDDLSGKDTEGQVRLIGERLKNIEDPAKRAAAAMALFGKSGADLLPFFDNLPIAEKTLDRFNARLSSLDVTRVLALGDSFDAVGASVQGIGNELLTPFIGAAQSVADSMASVFASFGKVLGNVLDILSPVTSALGLFANVAGQVGSVLGNVIAVALEPFAAIGRGVASVFDAMSRAATEIFGRMNDVINGFGQFFQFNGALEVMNAAFSKLWETLERVGTIVTTAFGKVGTFIGGAVKSFLDFTGLTPAIEAIGGIISKVFGGVSSVFSTIANAIGGTVGRLLSMAERFLGIDNSAKKAAESTASLGDTVTALTEEEQKQAAERDKFLQGFKDQVSSAIDESAKFGKAGFDAALQYQTSIEELQRQFDKGILNETAFKRAAEEAKKAYGDQMDAIKQAAAETEAITKRVDGLLAKATELPQAQQDLNAVEAEIARVEASITSARAAGQTEQADALTARLAKLDQLQAGLEQQADEAAAGFTQGFDAAFANVDKGIGSLINKAAEFGNEGALAASQLQEGIAAAQRQVKDGILTKEAFDNEVERQKQLFEDRVSQLRQAEQISGRIVEQEAALRDRQFEIELERANELANVRTGSVQINDLRSGGISQFFETLQEDPAIAEAKKQRAELEKIRKEIAKLNAERVDILAGTG